MLKLLIVTLSIMPVSLAAIAVAPALAQDKVAEDTLGLCGLHNLSGYSAIDAVGSLVNLTQYCHQQQVQPSASPFWQSFLVAADRNTVAYAEALGQQQVAAYGTAICPFLENGGTLAQLRQIQVSGELPSGFEVAVAVAAIHTYCPTYRSEMGRSSLR
jgi:Protein of unknown function (DUF732)